MWPSVDRAWTDTQTGGLTGPRTLHLPPMWEVITDRPGAWHTTILTTVQFRFKGIGWLDELKLEKTLTPLRQVLILDYRLQLSLIFFELVTPLSSVTYVNVRSRRVIPRECISISWIWMVQEPSAHISNPTTGEAWNMATLKMWPA